MFDIEYATLIAKTKQNYVVWNRIGNMSRINIINLIPSILEYMIVIDSANRLYTEVM